MTREAMKHGAVNLSQGFPDFAAPEDIKRVAMQAIADDVNQYAITWGAKDFREAIAKKTKWYLGLEIDPETRNHGHLRLNRRNDRRDDGDRRSGRRSHRLRTVL